MNKHIFANTVGVIHLVVAHCTKAIAFATVDSRSNSAIIMQHESSESSQPYIDISLSSDNLYKKRKKRRKEVDLVVYMLTYIPVSI